MVLNMAMSMPCRSAGLTGATARSCPFPSRSVRVAHGFRNKRKQGSRKLFVRAQEMDSAATVPSKLAGEPSVYFEPLLRSAILGVSASIVFEGLHFASKFLSVAGEMEYRDLVQALLNMRDHFAPLIVNDHIVALGCWILFYIVEAYAVLKVMEEHSQNPAAAAYALRGLTTWPKRMLPRMNFFKDFLRPIGLSGQMFQTQAASAAIIPASAVEASSVVTAPPKPKKPLRPLPPILDPSQEPEGETAKPGDSLEKRRAAQGLRPGQLDVVTQGLMNRQKELSNRRAYLRNFWYAAGISEQIQDKPVGVEILGEKLVLFRDIDGKINCLQDVCPHRGAPMHKGAVTHVRGHECIVCPYHGWAFDTDGILRDVPAAETSNEWPRTPLIASFPVEEKGGFVWLFYGSKDMPVDERPPIPYVPELNDPQWRPVFGEIEFECSHWGVFENAIDMAHIHYLHSDSFGNEEHPEIKDMTCTTNAYGISADFALHNKPVNALWGFSEVPEVKVNAKAMLPSTSVIGFSLNRGLSFITFVNTVPISATRTINRFALIRRLDVDKIGSRIFNLPLWDTFARQAMIKILKQDKAMVENLLPETLGREISVKADLPQTAFRKLRQEYIAMGYGIDPDLSTTKSQQKDM